MNLFTTGYLRLTPQPFWWGAPVPRTCHAMLTVPLDGLSWAHLGSEEFAGEACDVVEAVRGEKREKSQRLWVGRKSGRVRGALSYLADSRPNELARFDDYREVAPGVWLPFREARTHDAGNTLRRTELVIIAARTDTDLTARYAGLLPRVGDQVQDQRFSAAVNLVHGDKRTDDEIRKLADAEYRKQLQGQEEFQRIVKPLDALVGKPAPALPADGWVGGKRPDVAGKPYLVHFWATWCGPCKADLAPLKALASSGIKVVGMHPPGTPAAEVEKVVRDRELGYPTFVAAGKWDGKSGTICGYPAAVFPYCVLVDAQGKVAAHGLLSEVTGRLRTEASLAELAGRPALALDVGACFNVDSWPTEPRPRRPAPRAEELLEHVGSANRGHPGHSSRRACTDLAPVPPPTSIESVYHGHGVVLSGVAAPGHGRVLLAGHPFRLGLVADAGPDQRVVAGARLFHRVPLAL
jgi:thiol-disulfide isomerase/thioredoxin